MPDKGQDPIVDIVIILSCLFVCFSLLGHLFWFELVQLVGRAGGRTVGRSVGWLAGWLVLCLLHTVTGCCLLFLWLAVGPDEWIWGRSLECFNVHVFALNILAKFTL